MGITCVCVDGVIGWTGFPFVAKDVVLAAEFGMTD